MFTWLNKQGVQSEKGFSVQSVGRFTIEYREDAKRLTISVDNGYSAGRFYEIVKRSNFSRWDDGMPISLSKQQEILQNFTDAMEFQGIGVIVE